MLARREHVCICYLVRQENQERSAKKLIKVTSLKDISKIENIFVRDKVELLLHYLLNEYSEFCIDGNISSIGAIFYVENHAELFNYKNFGMIESIAQSSFEFMEDIGNGISHGVIVVSTDIAISIFAPTKSFNEYFERNKE